jgi:hypothetical protein
MENQADFCTFRIENQADFYTFRIENQADFYTFRMESTKINRKITRYYQKDNINYQILPDTLG